MSRQAIKWATGGVIILLALFALMSGWNSVARWLPWTSQWTARTATARADQAEAIADVLQREAVGNAEIGQSVDTFHTREVIYRDITTQAQTEARNAPDAETPLSDERADRLRSADAGLCDATGLCARPAPNAAPSR